LSSWDSPGSGLRQESGTNSQYSNDASSNTSVSPVDDFASDSASAGGSNVTLSGGAADAAICVTQRTGKLNYYWRAILASYIRLKEPECKLLGLSKQELSLCIAAKTPSNSAMLLAASDSTTPAGKTVGSDKNVYSDGSDPSTTDTGEGTSSASAAASAADCALSELGRNIDLVLSDCRG